MVVLLYVDDVVEIARVNGVDALDVLVPAHLFIVYLLIKDERRGEPAQHATAIDGPFDLDRARRVIERRNVCEDRLALHLTLLAGATLRAQLGTVIRRAIVR